MVYSLLWIAPTQKDTNRITKSQIFNNHPELLKIKLSVIVKYSQIISEHIFHYECVLSIILVYCRVGVSVYQTLNCKSDSCTSITKEQSNK